MGTFILSVNSQLLFIASMSKSEVSIIEENLNITIEC